MASTNTLPPNAIEEIFPDSFRAQAFDLTLTDPLAVPRLFEPVPLAVSLRTSYVDAGLVPPLALVIASPRGVHEARELDEVPLAVVFYPDSGGRWLITLREVAHNQWWGQAAVAVPGGPS